MTSVEDQVRATLHDMADEARSAPLLQRLERASVRSRTQRTPVLVAAAASVLAIAIVAASLVWVRADRSAIVEPTVDPPKVFRLSDTESGDPGRGAMLVVLADANARQDVHDKPAYLLTAEGSAAVLVEESDTVATWTEHLSQDGTRLVRQIDAIHGSSHPVEPSLEIVDLRTGAIEALHDVAGACPALSPDNRAVAAYGESDTRIIDVESGRLTILDRSHSGSDPQHCGAVAWSPDSTRLLVPSGSGSRLIDREGRTLARLPGLRAVNGSMSWSPDGSSVLLYDRQRGRQVTRQLDGEDETVLTAPAGAVRLMGWAGSRIVWLAGPVGVDQRLVTTDARGGDPRLWTRLMTRGMAVETVSWSTPLRGSARD